MEAATADQFAIEIDGWLEAAGAEAADRLTGAALRILVDGQPLCEAEDLTAKTVRPEFRASAHRLAVWLVANWWRLRWEPQRQSTDWKLSHMVGAAGGGYAWPALGIISDGRYVTLESRPTGDRELAPVRYIRSGRAHVPARAFEDAVDAFVDMVVARLTAVGLHDTDLHSLLRERARERGESDLAEWCRLEAVMGFDPAEGPQSIVRDLLTAQRDIGRGAVSEIAAFAGASSPGLLSDMEAYLDASEARIDLAPIVQLQRRLDREGSRPGLAWNNGRNAAREARAAWQIGAGPLKNRTLAELFGFQAPRLSRDHSPAAPAAVARRRETSDPCAAFGLRSRYSVGRRVEMSRLLGDLVIAEADDMLFPVTGARTYRQLYQHAFAQELLCPWDELREFVSGRVIDDDLIERAAHHYLVSTRMIAGMLYEHGRLSRDLLAA